MITGTLKNQVDRIWDAMWSGGIANSLTVVEQITYLLFARRLDELHTAREKAAALCGGDIEDPIFSPKENDLRWSRFKDFDPERMFAVFRDRVFPFIKNLNTNSESAYARFMKDAVFVIPTPGLLERVVTMLSDLDMTDRDTKGDVYEYMLGKLAVEGRNGQFRTPRHIIRMMVELTAPTPEDIIGDPACGTGGFLIGAGEYLREHHSDLLSNPKTKKHFHQNMFHGADFDSSMLRIGAMNLMLHGSENPDIRGIDSLSSSGESLREKYTLVLANPPFKGSLDYDSVAKDLLQVARTKKTELLFLSLFLKQLKTGGRCACIVPDGVLFGSSKAHRAIRTMLVEEQKLDGIVSMPSGVFKPYAGVSTAIMVFTRTDSGGTASSGGVWFYDMQHDGYSLDDKRDATPEENDIPDIIERWQGRDPAKDTDRKSKAFFVPVEEIRENDYDLSINRYKEIEYVAPDYDPPEIILDQLEALEEEIMADLKELREMIA